MKTRIQMMTGLLNDTLTDEEKKVALANDVVVRMVAWAKEQGTKKKLTTKKKPIKKEK